MKKLITLLFVLLTVTSYSQRNPFKKKNKEVESVVTERELITPPDFEYEPIKYIGHLVDDTTFNEGLVIKEFVRLVDSIREYKYMTDLMETEIDTLINKACEYHNDYMANMVDTVENLTYIITHDEIPSFGKSVYVGDNPLVTSFMDRITMTTDSTVQALGEVLLVGPLNEFSNQNTDEKDIARNLLGGFWNSPKHMEYILARTYVVGGGDIKIFKRGDGLFLYFNYSMGHKIIKTVERSEYYYPGNPLGLTEYNTSYETIMNY
jgi:hypothetical protein